MGQKISYAEEWAASAWRKYDLGIPVDLDVVRRGLHLRLRRRPLPMQDTGCIARTAKTVYILVNSLHPPQRQRFTIAHEIGEFLLARYNERNGRKLAQGEARERFCDRFAVCLLMPTDRVRQAAAELYHHKQRNDKTDVLAGMFGVSVQAMSLRLWELGLNVGRSRRRISPAKQAEWDARLEAYRKELMSSADRT